MTTNKFIYRFGRGWSTEGNAHMEHLLGGKGANLAQMSKLGLPIPPGFTIATVVWEHYYKNGNYFAATFEEMLAGAIQSLEQVTGKIFGSAYDPLLLSVRSGASISMPGMMDTLLNIGMNGEIAQGLAKKTHNPQFAYDSYRRFLQMYGSIVLGVPNEVFDTIYERYKIVHLITQDREITATILQEIIVAFQGAIRKHTGKEVASDPYQQLKSGIEAILKSWMSPRAVLYRKIHNITNSSGTAVNIQAMVFGNKGNTSATGVVFTRNPSNGEKKIFGECLINAQGEDIVSGMRTPSPIGTLPNGNRSAMHMQMPEAYNELMAHCHTLEAHYGDMQDIEFTIEEGKVYILQTRRGKRTAAAAVKVAVDMVTEGMITRQEALMRIDPASLHQLLHTVIDYTDHPEIIAKGLPASPGASTGIAMFSPYDAEKHACDHKVILVRNVTSPEDIKGMQVSVGLLTAKGGMTSHAAVVARGIGKPCICGVEGLFVNEKQHFFTTSSGHIIRQGDKITIDGTAGTIMRGEVTLIEPTFSEAFHTLLEWADCERDMDIRSNAETVADTATALKFGAEGIGLCRTEHMFFAQERISLVRELIIAEDATKRTKALQHLHALQAEDFKNLFQILEGKPINIRLLDPPLHEFLPTEAKEQQRIAAKLQISQSAIARRLHALHEMNPMLGHRGCRLAISYPEIYVMQTEAIVCAMHRVYVAEKIESKVELMIPFICEVKELQKIKSYIDQTIARMEAKFSQRFNIQLGTMIELPRAALTAAEIAPIVTFFSFGTNDLTQTTFGISRDDMGNFLPDYIAQKIFTCDPFTQIDEAGVGELIKIAISQGKIANPQLRLSVCGEHAANAASIDFFQKVGIHYLSCSPYNVPIARVAAAQSKIKFSERKDKKQNIK